MSKKKKNKKSAAATGTSAGENPLSRNTSGASVLIMVLATTGVVLTGYLSYIHWFAERAAFCSVGSGCDLVQSSRFSVLFGLPLAAWGLLNYLGIAAFAAASRKNARRLWQVLWLALIGAVLSIYFQALSALEIEAFCPWCVASAALMLILAVLSALATMRVDRNRSLSSSLPLGVTCALVLCGFLHLHWSGVFDPAAGPEDPYLRDLAIHLGETGAHFYGAYWCPHCQDQKEIFAASQHRLPYVECSPGGRNGPRAGACIEADIRNYPTWVIRGRKLGGIMTPEALAKQSGFEPKSP